VTSRPLRFLMVTTFYPPYNFGGDGIFVRRLSRELARRGHHVEIVHCADAHRLVGGAPVVAEAERDEGLIVHTLKSPFGPLSPLATQQTGLPLFKISALHGIFERGFDVIHFHNISLVGGPGILALGRAVKLYTFHEYWLLCQNHILFRDRRAPCFQPRCLSCNLHYWRPPQWWRATRLLEQSLRHVDQFLAASRFTMELHRRKWPWLPMVHHPHFVSDLHAPSDVTTQEPADPYFLCVSRLERLKGLHTVIPLFQRWDKARLLIAGQGDDERELRQLAGDNPRIRFLGFRSESELSALYRKAVALIVPSLCFEISPLVIIESLAQGTPIIGRNLGSIPELIAESGGGLVYDSESDLLAAMERLLADRAQRDRLGNAGQQAGNNLWSADAHLDRYLSIVERMRPHL